MTSDQKPNIDADNESHPLKFESLIGGTLDATVKEQARAAQTSWEFINQISLTNEPNTKQEKTD